jgi:hypothetical protein
MARLESIAVGGYYPTPEHLLAPIGSKYNLDFQGTIVDPCAGEGTALRLLSPACSKRLACELEATRYAKLKQSSCRGYRDDLLHGDAFHVLFDKSSANLLYLNPPYDTDRKWKRLEERFLSRFASILVENGLLIFVVPFYALAASARTLACNFVDLNCFKFPVPDFDNYSQVVLYARRSLSLSDPDPKIQQQVIAWSNSDEGIPVLEMGPKIYDLSDFSISAGWEVQDLDYSILLPKIRLWKQTGKLGLMDIPNTVPSGSVLDVLTRKYVIATPPRPAHIASGIASGLFNGQLLKSEGGDLPDLLVKGVFDKDFTVVDEKDSADGKTVTTTLVQQPKLSITVLDMSTHKYHTLKPLSTGSTKIEDLGVQDLLTLYGSSMLSVLETQCPILFDPRIHSSEVSLAETTRVPYRAQSNSARALVRLLGGNNMTKLGRRGKGAILLGEIGSGKTTIALTVAKTIATKILVVCPPHLLRSWENEIKAVTPEAKVYTLLQPSDVADVISSEGLTVALLSRESAKLGHGWVAAGTHCSKCGAPVPSGDLAGKRIRCQESTRRPVNASAKTARALVNLLVPRTDVGSISKYADSVYITTAAGSKTGDRVPSDFLVSLVSDLLGIACMDSYQANGIYNHSTATKVLTFILAYLGDLDLIESCILRLLESDNMDAVDLAMFLAVLHPDRSTYGRLEGTLPEADEYKYMYRNKRSNNRYLFHIEVGSAVRGDLVLRRDDQGSLSINGIESRSIDLLVYVAKSLVLDGTWSKSLVCGEPLYQASPTPRRLSMAGVISKKYRNLFDLVIADECHEYATDGSAQSIAVQRLASMGPPCLFMTGSIMNGYAKSLFTNLWALSESFRGEFKREDLGIFTSRYGYKKKTVISGEDQEKGDITGYGKTTDKVVRSSRMSGDAPGVLPLLLFKYLLPISVTVQKEDLDLDLPPNTQEVVLLSPGQDLLSSYESLKGRLVDQVKSDRFEAGRSGKLFGALSELPSYLDRAAIGVGNQSNGRYEVKYPASAGGSTVAIGDPKEADRLQPKEEWLCGKIADELAEGRRVMVFCWHINLISRLKTLIEGNTGAKVEVLLSNKVSPAKRQDWIDAKVVRKNIQVLITNPVSVQTGLNNLVHFSTEIWYENPACNPIIFRQAIGRIDRIGQTKPTRIFVPVYEGTLQQTLADLLLRKTATSIATDGLDPETALASVGAQESEAGYLTGLSLGRQIWAMISDQD